jgi:hypothetical protein
MSSSSIAVVDNGHVLGVTCEILQSVQNAAVSQLIIVQVGVLQKNRREQKHETPLTLSVTVTSSFVHSSSFIILHLTSYMFHFLDSLILNHDQ